MPFICGYRATTAIQLLLRRDESRLYNVAFPNVRFYYVFISSNCQLTTLFSMYSAMLFSSV